MKRSALRLPALVLAVLAGHACMKQAIQPTYDKQATNIESFVTAQTKADTTATVVYRDRSVRITLHDTLAREGMRTDSLRSGGTVSFYYAGYLLTGSSVSNSNLFATNREATAAAAGWNITDTTAFRICTLTLDQQLLPGLRSGLDGVRSQDECYILFTGENAYGSHAQGTIPARSALAYHIWINSISNE